MTRESLLSLIAQLLEECWDLRDLELKEDTFFSEDLGLDSLDIVALLAFLEQPLDADLDRTGIEFSELATAAGLLDFLEGALGRSPQEQPHGST